MKFYHCTKNKYNSLKPVEGYMHVNGGSLGIGLYVSATPLHGYGSYEYSFDIDTNGLWLEIGKKLLTYNDIESLMEYVPSILDDYGYTSMFELAVYLQQSNNDDIDVICELVSLGLDIDALIKWATDRNILGVAGNNEWALYREITDYELNLA